MKRHAPEDRSPKEFLPLFDSAPVETARARGHAGARAAAKRAARVEPAWKAEALAAVREHARRNEVFLSEHVAVPIPSGCDRRAIGHVMKEAERLGYVRADGYAPAVSSNGSPKCRWRSLVYEGGAA